MIYLIDRKLVPAQGIFRFQALTHEEFMNVIKIAIQDDELDNRIVDTETVDLLKQITESAIPYCPIRNATAQITLATGDAILMANVAVTQPHISEVDPDKPIPQQAKVTCDIIIAYHFDYTPTGMVGCVVDTQIASQMPKTEWYKEFRDQLVAEIPEPDDEENKKTQVQMV